MIFLGGTPLGSPLVGWVGETFGARWMLIGGGVVSFIGIGLATAWYVHRQGELPWRPRRPRSRTAPLVEDDLVLVD